MNVKIYTTSNCQWSKKTKEWLKKKKIAFQEFDVEEEQNYVYEVIQKTGQLAFPVIIVEDLYVVGFVEEQVEKLLKAK